MGSLRKVEGVYHDLTVPEMAQTVQIRAMKVREVKTLLTAIEMKDQNAIINAVLDITEAAVRSRVDIRSLPMHIIDYIFLKLYTKTSGEQTAGIFTCGGTVTVPAQDATEDKPSIAAHEEPCGSKVKVPIDLDSASLMVPPDYVSTAVIDVGDGQTIKLKVPSLDSYKKVRSTVDIEIPSQFIFAAIECITDGDDVKTPTVDFSAAEFNEWLEDLDPEAVDRINSFFRNIPILGLDVEVTCPKCDKKETFGLRGLQDFFF